MSATEALDIPHWCAHRSELIEDLATVNDGKEADLPLPLTMSEVKAWLACAQQVETVVDKGMSCLKQDDDTLTSSLKVRDIYILRSRGFHVIIVYSCTAKGVLIDQPVLTKRSRSLSMPLLCKHFQK